MSVTQNNKDSSNGRWTKEQHQKFLIGLQMFGKNWKKIQSIIETRTGSQIRSHAQKFFLKMQKTVESNTQELKHFEEPPSLSHSTCELDKPSEMSYFFGQILKKSQKNEQFDFWVMMIDNPTNSSKVNTGEIKRKGSFVQYENEEGPNEYYEIEQIKMKSYTNNKII